MFFLLLFGLMMSSEASNEIYSKHLRGSRIKEDSVITINAQHYDRYNWIVANPFVRVRLYLAEDRYRVHSNGEDFTVIYDITLTGNNIPSISKTDTLSVGYRQNSPYRDLDMNEYQNYKAASLTIRNAPPNITDDIILELQLCYPRYTGTTSIGTPFDVRRRYLESTNELLVTWGYLDGADEYDLEWLFVDNPSASNNVLYDFANATRITTSDNYYKIPLAYPKGNILCRVRGRGSMLDHGNYYPVFGPWSFANSSGNTIPDTNHICRYDYQGLEDSLTWQCTTVYAEEGKRKEVISFYDGTLRKRQEVTALNTDNIAIVGETFYDYVGRQALQAIPAPVSSRGIRYYGVNGSSNGLFNGNFPKSQYDEDATLTHTPKFPSDAGSAVYFSSNNPFAGNQHWPNASQIPWDSGYTYTHIRYLNDGTDRVHSQSNVGSTFKMGGGHETKYYYGNPFQAELDRLFGNEVGDASHYQKVIAVDANGEISVSYYDMKERLIASAVVPNSSNAALLSIDSTPPKHELHDSVVFDENSRQYVQNIAVGVSSTYTFRYVVSPPFALCDTCHEQTGCMDCRYKVLFNLWNLETLTYLFKDSLTIHSGETIEHTITLYPGSYQLYKSITPVNDDTTAAAFDQFRGRQRRCAYYTPATIHPCYTPCQEYAMEQAGIEVPDTTKLEYVQALAACENPPQSFNTECEAKRAAMLADMSPGGQYFDNIRTCCPGDTTCYCPTKPNGFLNTICDWRLEEDTQLVRIRNVDFHLSAFSEALWDSMRFHWRPEYAEVMLKYHPEYHLYQAMCDCGSPEDVKAQHCFDSIFMNTYEYDSAEVHGLLNPLGLVKYLSTDIQRDFETGYQPFDSIKIDPFFGKETKCCNDSVDAMRQHIIRRLNGYLSWDNNYLSLWWLLDNPEKIDSSYCPAEFLPIQNAVVAVHNSILPLWATYYGSIENAKWMLFKSVYTYLKNEVRQTFLPACLLSCSIGQGDRSVGCCYKPDFQWGQGEWWSEYFGSCSDSICRYYLDADTGCSAMPLTVGQCADSAKGGFQIRFLCNPVYSMTLESLRDSAASSRQVLYENCCEDCIAYANSWMDELHDYFSTYCSDIFSGDSARWFSFRQKLVDLCVNSCNSSKTNRDFSISQRIHPDTLALLLEDICSPLYDNYPRIVYPHPKNVYVDCGCDRYQSVLHAYGLTFWSDVTAIADSLANERIFAQKDSISAWNSFCIWERYGNMLDGIDDTAALYSLHFPEEFRCQPDLPDSILCRLQAVLEAVAQDTISLYHVLDSLVAVHRVQYTSHCMDNLNERLTVIDSPLDFLYTLYYYDQADNLIKTVPPKGAHVLTTQAQFDSVTRYRENIARYDTLQSGFVRPKHTMVTNYRYNSLNQVIQSYQPDYDSVSYVYYDILSRPILSQDGKQRQQGKHSYTVYDDIGRIVEVGQIENSTPVTRNDATDPTFVNQFLNNGVKSEVTFTWYDRATFPALNQTHLRNRIAAVSFCPDGDTLHPESATHYSYDIHGNVKRLVQDIPALSTYDRQFTALDYEYDLVSGNVNRVWFQKGKPEQFGHRYRYDADNRITHVYTSDFFKRKDTAWLSQERLEARYFYLPHGALARVELGHKQIQGLDYAYTLQGWLKDINGYRSSLRDVYFDVANFDIGGDGATLDDNLNHLFARDGFSSSLQYYTDDYRPVAGTNYFNDPSTDAVSLFNGNISALTTSCYQWGDPSLLKWFRYDKLNRIKQMRTATHSYDATGWNPLSDNFSTEYTYDWNGNLLSLQRKDETGDLMHNIRYNYTDTTKNRLSGISATGLHSGTYQYDALGNLVRDNAEGLTVGWNALGKVDTIRRNGNILTTFRYSPTGQRQVKATGPDTTFYIHDATGNVMCVYRLKNDTLTASERYIYGSKRLGMLGQQVWITAGGAARLQDRNTIGHRLYELTDHLGNVAVTFPDQKWLTHDANNEPIYQLEVSSFTDYYPFGFPMPVRSFNTGGYRYFFNGQESDAEAYGQGGLAGYEFRQYDARLGRWWGIDRKAAKYSSLSPYQFCAGNPILSKDLDGSDFVVVIDNSGDNKTITIQMNIYTASQEAFDKLLPAVEEINNITKKVTIDGVEYTLCFAINPVTPDPNQYHNFQSNLSADEMMIVNAQDRAKADGYYGNAFMGSNDNAGESRMEFGLRKVVGGKTFEGKFFYMNAWEGTRFIDYPQLISHELFHLLGLGDKGEPYYSSGGRMEYIATQRNNFYMNPISNKDIRNVVRYLLKINGDKEGKAKVKVEYVNDSVPIKSNSKIKVE